MPHEAIDERDPFSILAANEEGGDNRYLQGTMSIEAAFRLAEFAAAHPNKFRTLQVSRQHPEATQEQLAELLGIRQAAVHKHLTAAKLELRGSSNPAVAGSIRRLKECGSAKVEGRKA